MLQRFCEWATATATIASLRKLPHRAAGAHIAATAAATERGSAQRLAFSLAGSFAAPPSAVCRPADATGPACTVLPLPLTARRHAHRPAAMIGPQPAMTAESALLAGANFLSVDAVVDNASKSVTFTLQSTLPLPKVPRPLSAAVPFAWIVDHDACAFEMATLQRRDPVVYVAQDHVDLVVSPAVFVNYTAQAVLLALHDAKRGSPRVAVVPLAAVISAVAGAVGKAALCAPRPPSAETAVTLFRRLDTATAMRRRAVAAATSRLRRAGAAKPAALEAEPWAAYGLPAAADATAPEARAALASAAQATRVTMWYPRSAQAFWPCADAAGASAGRTPAEVKADSARARERRAEIRLSRGYTASQIKQGFLSYSAVATPPRVPMAGVVTPDASDGSGCYWDVATLRAVPPLATSTADLPAAAAWTAELPLEQWMLDAARDGAYDELARGLAAPAQRKRHARYTRAVAKAVDRFGFCVMRAPGLLQGGMPGSFHDRATQLTPSVPIDESAGAAAVRRRTFAVDFLIRETFGVIRNTHYGLTSTWGPVDAPLATASAAGATVSHGLPGGRAPEHLDTAYLSHCIGLHTDSTYFQEPPRAQAFGLIYAAPNGGSTGGLNGIADGFRIARDFAAAHPDAFWTLAQSPVAAFYAKEGQNLVARRPVFGTTTSSAAVTSDHRGVVVGRGHHNEIDVIVRHVTFNASDRAPMFLPCMSQAKGDAGAMAAFYEAYDLLDRFMHATADGTSSQTPAGGLEQPYKYQYMLQPQVGELLVFDNFRVLHARTAFAGPRVMCGAYVGTDDFQSLIRRFD